MPTGRSTADLTAIATRSKAPIASKRTAYLLQTTKVHAQAVSTQKSKPRPWQNRRWPTGPQSKLPSAKEPCDESNPAQTAQVKPTRTDRLAQPKAEHQNFAGSGSEGFEGPLVLSQADCQKPPLCNRKAIAQPPQPSTLLDLSTTQAQHLHAQPSPSTLLSKQCYHASATAPHSQIFACAPAAPLSTRHASQPLALANGDAGRLISCGSSSWVGSLPLVQRLVHMELHVKRSNCLMTS